MPVTSRVYEGVDSFSYWTLGRRCQSLSSPSRVQINQIERNVERFQLHSTLFVSYVSGRISNAHMSVRVPLCRTVSVLIQSHSTRRVRCTFHRICDVFHAAAVLSFHSRRLSTELRQTIHNSMRYSCPVLCHAMHAHDKGGSHAR